MQRFAAAGIQRAGGKVLGEVRTPLGSSDYAAALLQAQASGAQAIGLALSGADLVNAIKQAAEFRLTEGTAKLVAFGMFITDAHALGTKLAGGIDLATGFYWDRTEASRAWSQRYFQRMNRMPSQVQAGVYSAVRHYLKAVEAAQTTDTAAVAAKMRDLSVDDMATPNARIRADGRLLRDMYLVEIKQPSESHYPWDYYRIVATIPAASAFLPESESACPLLKQ
jgi:branched-chain amino acid transport system substrate-binding protein